MNKKTLPVISALLLLSAAAFANGAKDGYTVIRNGDSSPDETVIYYQVVRWEASNAAEYEVELERLTDELTWAAVSRNRTTGTSFEFSLPAGSYHFRIHSYNVLGQTGAVSEWTPLNVREAKAPQAERFSPTVFYEYYVSTFVLTIEGRNLVEDMELVLFNGSREVFPLSVSYSPYENKVDAVFKTADVKSGTYRLRMTNPGGKSQTLGGFRAVYTDVNISVGVGVVNESAYAQSLDPVSDYYPDQYIMYYHLPTTAKASESFVITPALNLRLSVVPFGRAWGWFGFELGLNYQPGSRRYNYITPLSPSRSIVLNEWI